MKIRFFIPLLLCLAGCSYFSKYNLHIPGHVTILKDSTDIRFPGTRVFIREPRGYYPVPQMVRIQRTPYDYISAFEDLGAPFEREKAAFLREGRTYYYEKEFQLGDYPAYISYGRDSGQATEKVTLLFGDSTFTVRVLARWPAGLTAARQDIVGALQSMYVDKSITPRPSEIQAFSADFSGTEFGPASARPPVFIYTLDGRPYSDDTSKDVLIITTSATSPNDTSMKSIVDNILQSYKDRGVNFQPALSGNRVIDSMPAYEYVGMADINRQVTTAYLLATGDSSTLITVIGSFTTRQEELVKEAQKVTGTLRVKALGQ